MTPAEQQAAEMKSREAALLRLLQEYGGHKITCPAGHLVGAACDCGWDAALTEALRGAPEDITAAGWLQG